MNEVQEARVVALATDVEEEVALRIGSAELVCFAGGWRPPLKSNDACFVTLALFAADGLEIAEVDDASEEAAVRLGNGFAYQVTGRLSEGRLVACGVRFESDELASEFAYLDGCMVSVKVDRIAARFFAGPARTLNPQ